MEIIVTDIKLTMGDFVTILEAMASDLKGHADEIQELDAALGDGDLGITVKLGADAIIDYLATVQETDFGKMLVKLGININKVNPSTFGTLLSSAFLGSGKIMQSKLEIVPYDLVAMGLGAIEEIKKRGKAEVGDKTMLDSLVPAVQALKKSLDETRNIIQAVEEAVLAAGSGFQSTANMKAKFGRASWRKDGGMGVTDGGAAAMYFIIESFSEHFTDFINHG
jgi:dihydroxyacetone kinase-like protein